MRSLCLLFDQQCWVYAVGGALFLTASSPLALWVPFLLYWLISLSYCVNAFSTQVINRIMKNLASLKVNIRLYMCTFIVSGHTFMHYYITNYLTIYYYAAFAWDMTATCESTCCIVRINTFSNVYFLNIIYWKTICILITN